MHDFGWITLDGESRRPLSEPEQWVRGYPDRWQPACRQAGLMRGLSERAAALISAEVREEEGGGRPISAVRLMVPAHLSACGHLPAPWQAGAQAGRPRPEALRAEAVDETREVLSWEFRGILFGY